MKAAPLEFACVWVGNAYGVEYVENLASMIGRHCSHPFVLRCLTDHANPPAIENVNFVYIGHLQLAGWWAKMALFNPVYRGHRRTVYFDLDTVICGPVDCLHKIDSNFAICKNLTRLAGNKKWPCRYGSCVMVFGPGWGYEIYERFLIDRQRYIDENPRGDQQAIEKLYPNAEYLQDCLPTGYLVGRRDFTDKKPKGACVMIFAGRHKPHNTPHEWLRKEWQQ